MVSSHVVNLKSEGSGNFLYPLDRICLIPENSSGAESTRFAGDVTKQRKRRPHWTTPMRRSKAPTRIGCWSNAKFRDYGSTTTVCSRRNQSLRLLTRSPKLHPRRPTNHSLIRSILPGPAALNASARAEAESRAADTSTRRTRHLLGRDSTIRRTQLHPNSFCGK
jgi:hypothetical protein